MFGKKGDNMEKKKIRIIKGVIIIITAVLLIAYVILVNVLVSAALVPSFMRKLESFERVSDECFSNQVYTSDIQINHNEAVLNTNKWLESVKWEKIYMESEDGYRLAASEFFPENEDHKWALVLHGYTGWKEEMYPFAYWYNMQGYHVIVPDLRCQGESEGDYIGMGWTDHYDCLGWLDYIISQDNDAEIVIHGQSMGAATALIMSGSETIPVNVKAVISDCAYTDAYTMFGDKVREWFNLPAFPLVDSACIMLMIRGGYNLRDASAVNAVKSSTVPTLFIHGSEDAMIPVDMARKLYEAEGAKKKLLIVEGAGHAQSQDKNPQLYYGEIADFLRDNGIK